MSSQMWWYVIRGSGLAAWAAAAASVLVGLAMSTGLLAVRRVRGLHSWLGGLAVVAIGLHLSSLVADSYMSFSWADVLVPFHSSWRPGAVAWGVGAFYLLLAVEATSLLRGHLPNKAWRAVHLASFFGFWAATMHAVTAGTYLGLPAVGGTVVLTVAAVLGLLLLRIGQSVVPGARARLGRLVRGRGAGTPMPLGRSHP
jgi:hypothetical protein